MNVKTIFSISPLFCLLSSKSDTPLKRYFFFSQCIVTLHISYTYTSLIFYWVSNSIATIMTIDQPTIAGVSKYCPKILMPLTSYVNNYSKVASSALFRLVAHFWIFRLFMKGKFDAYLCTVTFCQKSPKLNSSPFYCS